ncbi:MAG: fructosamine kinase family protein [Planctomycetes bacterium]|nr:fructosamine kinase family protein [Planctomycetota bacterium]
MADTPLNPPVQITTQHAQKILGEWLGEAASVVALTPLIGGCCNTVVEIRFDHPRSPVVIKAAHQPQEHLQREHATLRFFQKNTTFPLPHPYRVDISCEAVPFSYLLMQRLPGMNLGDASRWMTPADRLHLERQIAKAVSDLHTHTGPHFGSIHETSQHARWKDHFAADVQEEYDENCRLGLVSRRSLDRVAELLDHFDEIFDAPGQPTLVHGDIWATNIIVGGEPGAASLSGFVDGGGSYRHAESELAYLEIWQTVGSEFFEIYHRVHPPLAGYPRRRLIYWLDTLLLHVRCFKTHNYIRAAEQIIERLPI